MLQKERIADIEGFPNYAITDYGRVINTKKQTELTLSPTQYGDLTVGLMDKGYQVRRSVKVLVARAFVPGRSIVFNTPIQKDGDRTNLRATNLAWRPRWFAWNYGRQFENVPDLVYNRAIIDDQDTMYDCIMDAVIATGVMWKDVLLSIEHGYRVFPHAVRYRWYY